jgi:glycosyltransferase involved in cell wall biosynthesis
MSTRIIPPTVSVIVTTYNNHATLEACLQSIQNQDYEHIELIVVDNNSKDDTKQIARRFTGKVYNKGPERCAQRNYGISIASGDFAVIIDSDMELNRDVISSCVEAVQQDPAIKGLIIPEESFGQGFWAQCKRLERSFYVGIDWIEASRFYNIKTLRQVGGYNESLVSGEDWDLSQRVGSVAKIGRTGAFIRHNEGNIKLFRTLRKKSYYAKKFSAYTAEQAPSDAVSEQATSRNPYVIVLKRFGLFLSQPAKLFRNPATGVGVLFMKVCEFGFGAFGYLMPAKKESA